MSHPAAATLPTGEQQREASAGLATTNSGEKRSEATTLPAEQPSEVGCAATTHPGEELDENVPTAMHPGEQPAAGAPSPLDAIRDRVRHARTDSFQRFRKQMQRAWRWGPLSGGDDGGCGGADELEQGIRTTVNIEVMANQKRQWYQIHSKDRDNKQYKEPTSLFEHFFIVGLHSHANVTAIEDAFARRKAWESDVVQSDILGLRKIQNHRPIPALDPQILFKYPPGKNVEIREIDLPAFCFPEGVRARLLERTPSMSDLNEVIFGQEHLACDDSSFIFSLKVSDNAPLYGVCLYVQEIVQRTPGILGAISPLDHRSHKPSRFLVSAPRCYCLLTRIPFFELHYEMLNSIVAQERLDRITQFAGELSMIDFVSSSVTEDDQQIAKVEISNGNGLLNDDWMDYAIPVSSIPGLITPVGLHLERDNGSNISSKLDPHSPVSASASESSDCAQLKELDREFKQAWQQADACASENSESRRDSIECAIMYGSGQTSPDFGELSFPNKILDHVDDTESLHSPLKGVGSDEDDDELNLNHEFNAEKVIEWAKVHNNEPLQIICGYHALSIPPRGGEVTFYPLEHLQPVRYCRYALSSLDMGDPLLNSDQTDSGSNEINACLAGAEEALALSIWTVATICRALSLDCILSLLAGTLLEKQVVVSCANLGILSAIVLSVIPMIRPFEWHSLLLPILPRKLFDFLDAPVPFIVGIMNKSVDRKLKTPNLVRVIVEKDQVKSCSMPQLPRYKELVSDLSPIHTRLSRESHIATKHPVYKYSAVQAEAALDFLRVLRSYLESLCSDLSSHTITSIQSNTDRVSLLLKDSFVDSFSTKDRPFVKLFVDTQMFSVLSDSRLSRYESKPI